MKVKLLSFKNLLLSKSIFFTKGYLKLELKIDLWSNENFDFMYFLHSNKLNKN